MTRRSRSWLDNTFVSQNSRRVAGSFPFRQACPCQKHPLMNMTDLCLRKTMSGEPGSLWSCNRNRKPSACSSLRTANSGAVCCLLTLRIRADLALILSASSCFKVPPGEFDLLILESTRSRQRYMPHDCDVWCVQSNLRCFATLPGVACLHVSPSSH